MRIDFHRTAALAALCCFSVGCVGYPNRVEARTTSRSDFLAALASQPMFQWEYAGSDTDFHYFVQWRVGDVLLPLPVRSYLSAYKVPKDQASVEPEMPRSTHMRDWRACSYRTTPHGVVFTDIHPQ